MQFIGSIFVIFILFHLKLIELAPTDSTTADEHEQMRAGSGSTAHQSPASQTAVVHSPFHLVEDMKNIDMHIVADAARKAADEWRQKIELDNCNFPKAFALKLPSNDEFSWTGCNELVELNSRIIKAYQDTNDILQGADSRRLNSLIYEGVFQKVKKFLRRKCIP